MKKGKPNLKAFLIKGQNIYSQFHTTICNRNFQFLILFFVETFMTSRKEEKKIEEKRKLNWKPGLMAVDFSR